MPVLEKQSLQSTDLAVPLNFDSVVAILKEKKQPVEYEEETVSKAIALYNQAFLDPSKITYEQINNIAKEEYSAIKKQHSSLTKTINVVEGAGLFHIMEELEKGLKDAELERLYHRACSIKPSLYSRVMHVIGVGSKYKTQSLKDQFSVVTKDTLEKSQGLDSVLVKLEKDVIAKKSQAINSLGHLKTGFGLYFKQLQLLSTQYLLSTLVLDNYSKYVSYLNTLNKDNALVQKQIIEAEQYLGVLQNKQATILNTITQVPLRTNEYSVMIDAIGSIIIEADCTLDSKFTSIRESLNSLSIAIKAKQSLIGQQNINNIARQVSFLSTKAVADLAKETVTLSSSNRLQDSKDIQQQLQHLIQIKADVVSGRTKEKEQYEQATQIMLENIENIKTHLIENKEY